MCFGTKVKWLKSVFIFRFQTDLPTQPGVIKFPCNKTSSRSGLSIACTGCQFERSLCCQDAPSFGNSLTKTSHLSPGDPWTVRSCVGWCIVSVSLNGPCVVTFGNSLTKMSHLSPGDPWTVRSCVGWCIVSVSLNGPCVVTFGNSLTKMSHLSPGDPRTVRSCVGGLVSVSLNGPCVLKMPHLSATA